MNKFLARHVLPKLTQEEIKSLNRPIVSIKRLNQPPKPPCHPSAALPVPSPPPGTTVAGRSSSPWRPRYLSSRVSLCHSDWVISISLSPCWLILSSVPSILPVTHPLHFYSSYCVSNSYVKRPISQRSGWAGAAGFAVCTLRQSWLPTSPAPRLGQKETAKPENSSSVAPWVPRSPASTLLSLLCLFYKQYPGF